MAWVRIDDSYDDHPKVLAVGSDAAYLNLRAIMHCNRQETDGHVREAVLDRIGSDHGPRKRRDLVSRLVAEGLWHAAGHTCPDCPPISDGWYIHDYLDYQPSARTRDEKRAEARERMRRVRSIKTPRSPDVRANNERSSRNVRSTPDPARTRTRTQPPKSRGSSSSGSDEQRPEKPDDVRAQPAAQTAVDQPLATPEPERTRKRLRGIGGASDDETQAERRHKIHVTHGPRQPDVCRWCSAEETG